MFKFLTIFIYVAFVNCAPQGYSYQSQQQQNVQSVSHTTSTHFGSAPQQQVLSTPQFTNSNFGPAPQQQVVSTPHFTSSNFGPAPQQQVVSTPQQQAVSTPHFTSSNFASAPQQQAVSTQQFTSSNFGPAPQQHLPAPQFTGSSQFANIPSGQQSLFHQAVPQLGNIPNQHAFQHHHAAPVVTKDIYIHAAPEEIEDQSVQQQQVPNLPPRKHYRIVFIKAPSAPSASQQAIKLSQAQTEEKTIIYVLSKKEDAIDIQQALQDIQPTPPSKPEVFFIKYKTQEEAAHAQRQIQAQYDSLGGSTQVSDEGIAPVTSVIGSLNDHHHGVNGGVQTANNAQAAYLPPAKSL